jgi:hypothetical protein
MTICDPFYYPTKRRVFAKISMTSKGKTEEPVKMHITQLYEVIEQAIALEALENKSTDGKCDIDTVAKLLVPYMCKMKNLPEDTELRDLVWGTTGFGKNKKEEEITVNHFLFGRAGMYYWIMQYTKVLDRLGYIERWTDAGARITELKRAKVKEPLHEVLAKEILTKGENK